MNNIFSFDPYATQTSINPKGLGSFFFVYTFRYLFRKQIGRKSLFSFYLFKPNMVFTVWKDERLERVLAYRFHVFFSIFFYNLFLTGEQRADIISYQSKRNTYSEKKIEAL
jgi:hypothetical protein